MARKPSKRRHFSEPDQELNLIPMMNLISLLIPCLLISMVFIEIATINVAAPAIGSDAAAEPPKDKPEKPPLNLTITVTDKGYTVAGSGGVLGGSDKAGAEAKGGGPTIPSIQKQVKCDRYVGTWAPPRSKNRGQSKCEDSNENRNFWVYDTEALVKKLVEIKDAFPEERRVIIAAEAGVEFEAITDVMDSSRDLKSDAEERRELFPEVVLSPGLS